MDPRCEIAKVHYKQEDSKHQDYSSRGSDLDLSYLAARNIEWFSQSPHWPRSASCFTKVFPDFRCRRHGWLSANPWRGTFRPPAGSLLPGTSPPLSHPQMLSADLAGFHRFLRAWAPSPRETAALGTADGSVSASLGKCSPRTRARGSFALAQSHSSATDMPDLAARSSMLSPMSRPPASQRCSRLEPSDATGRHT
jgi:hypothetical protein